MVLFSQRIASLPFSLKSFVLSYNSSAAIGINFAARRTFSSITRVQHSNIVSPCFPRLRVRPRTWRTSLWLIPIVGGISIYLSPSPQLHLASVFSSPTLIPCPEDRDNTREFTNEDMIGSPAEPHQSILSRMLWLVQDYIWEPVLTARRFIYLFYLFVPVMIMMPMLLVGNPEKRLQGDRWGAVWWYGFLVARMQAAGPTFTKLAQWAATRADLFPSQLCDRMGATHSQGRPHSLAYTKQVIEGVFEKPFDDVFEEFDAKPIGTGAIAQVYRATLKHDLLPPSYLGPKRQAKSPAGSLAPVILQDPPPSVPTASVAIKVLHPRVSKMIGRDLAIMSFFANIITLLPGMRWLSLPEEVLVFGEMMNRQLDLRNEAENLLVFERNFAPRNVPVTFPRPLRVFSTADILVEEFENAVPLETFLKNGGGPFDDQVATIGLDAFLNMLLLDNFVHSDLHPGNIMVKFTRPPTTRDFLYHIFNILFSQSDWCDPVVHYPAESDAIVSRLKQLKNEEWKKELQRVSDEGYIPEIVFIDAGLVTTLNSTNRKNFLDLFRAVAEFDGYRTGQLMVERCRTPELAIDTEIFALKMQHIVLSVKRKTFSLGQIKISDILKDVLKAVREHHVKMEADFINTVISILLLEGIGRQLDPSLDLFKCALPILRQLGRQMTAQESITHLPSSNLGALLKVWMWLEARQLASAAFVDVDDLVKYDLLVPSV
ncbi:ABC1-domain-containing protein [Paxillus ammoniavirescens]|nr:ABC1-domain-containing protein [Paxillus ammoniavirescens]